MSHLILEAKWGSRDWELLGSAEKNDSNKVNRLYSLLGDWNHWYTGRPSIKFRIREVDK